MASAHGTHCKAVTQHFAALFTSQRFVDKSVTRIEMSKEVGIKAIVYVDVQNTIRRPRWRTQPWDILAHRDYMCNACRVEYLFIRGTEDV